MTPDEREITTSETETDEENPPPPPTAPLPKSGRDPPAPPPRDEWIEQRVWDAWEQRYEIKWVKVRFVSINKEPEIPPLLPVLQRQVDEFLEKERRAKEEEADKNIKKEEEVYKNIKKSTTLRTRSRLFRQISSRDLKMKMTISVALASGTTSRPRRT